MRMIAEYEWGARDISGMFGPEPFKMPSEKEARKQAKGDPYTLVVRRAIGADKWEVVK